MVIAIPNSQPKTPEIPTRGIKTNTVNKLYEIAKLLLGKKKSTKNRPPNKNKNNKLICKNFKILLFTSILI